MINMTLSASSLNNMQLCMRKFKFEKIDKIVPMHKAEALEKGDLLHVLLENYYKHRMILLDANDNKVDLSKIPFILKEVVSLGRQHADTLGITAQQSEVIIEYFKMYVDKYKNEDWIPLGTEVPFSKVLFESEELDLRVIVEGKLDLSILAMKKPALVDHKSASKNSKASGLSNQFMLYCWAFGVNVFIRNSIVFVKTPELMFNRAIITYNQGQIDDWYENTVMTVLDVYDKIKRGIFPANFTSCDKFGACSYASICSKAPEDRPYEIKANYKTAVPHDVFKVKDEINVASPSEVVADSVPSDGGSEV